MRQVRTGLRRRRGEGSCVCCVVPTQLHRCAPPEDLKIIQGSQTSVSLGDANLGYPNSLNNGKH